MGYYVELRASPRESVTPGEVERRVRLAGLTPHLSTANRIPRIAETLLPTLRFGLALALGLIAVSEMLGAQYGLGYLMQTSRATFSLNVLILCAFLLGVIATASDMALRYAWPHIVTWRR